MTIIQAGRTLFLKKGFDGNDRILAIGYEGQYLIIDRELDLVTVFFNKLVESDFILPYDLYTSLIVSEFKNQ